jgi:hypothetical protein
MGVQCHFTPILQQKSPHPQKRSLPAMDGSLSCDTLTELAENAKSLFLVIVVNEK